MMIARVECDEVRDEQSGVTIRYMDGCRQMQKCVDIRRCYAAETSKAPKIEKSHEVLLA